MKNKLTLSLLFSLFAGVALHASDAYKQEMDALIKKTLPDVVTWYFLSQHTKPSPIVLVFAQNDAPLGFVSPHLPKNVCEPVFTNEKVDYIIASASANVSAEVTKASEWKINGKNEVTLTPIAQQ